MIKSSCPYNKYFLFGVVTLSFLGTGFLSSFGYEMGSNASSNFTKIHPVSYLLTFISIFNLAQIKDKKVIDRSWLINRLEIQLLVFLTFIFVYLYFTSNLDSVSFIVDTLLCPILLAANFRQSDARLKWKTRKFSLQLILVNSYIAIVERVFSVNIFPIETGYGEVFRSTALLGHPLNNALITLVFFLYVSSIAIPPFRKIIIMATLFVALICFGARGALYASILGFLLLFLTPVFTSNRPYFKKINKFYIVLLAISMVCTLVFLTLNTSLGERLVEASFYDSSSEVRLQSLDLIDLNNIGNYLFAKSQDRINMISYYSEVKIIENFFIIWILKFGLIITVLLLLLIYRLFYRRMSVKGTVNKHIIILLFLLAAATNNSLATNTQALTLFVALFCLARRGQQSINLPLSDRSNASKKYVTTKPFKYS